MLHTVFQSAALGENGSKNAAIRSLLTDLWVGWWFGDCWLLDVPGAVPRPRKMDISAVLTPENGLILGCHDSRAY